jgi:hypothetical protein
MPIARIAAGLAGLAVLAAAEPAVADTPKPGYYIDAKTQAYVIVTAKRNAVKSFQAACMIRQADGTTTQAGSVYLAKAKRIKIKANGSFKYDGTALLPSSSGKRVQVHLKIDAKFSAGKVKGTYSPGADTACLTTPFSGRYYGKHPQG